MLTKAIVEQIIDEYTVKVRIPFWDNAYGTSDATVLEDLPEATLCASAGIIPVLSPGEVVFIECENTELDSPVVLGTLIRENMNSAADITARSLSVEVDCHFPKQFWDQVNDFINPRIQELQTQIDNCLNPENSAIIYGVEWDFSNSSTKITRLTVSSDPNHLVTDCPSWEPMAAVGREEGASPFDEVAPWKNMIRYKYNSEEIYVKIPEYWYKYDLDTTNSKLRIYISDTALSDFIHDDRSNYYVARYTCDSNYKSIPGGLPKVSETRASFRTNIANKDRTYHTFFQYDFATMQSIWRLYIVEYADWNSQKTIGAGASALADIIKNGTTDTMMYHTGTCGEARNDNTAAVQYRWIENPFGNAAQFVDGVNFYNRRCYYCIDPSKYSDTSSSFYIDTACVLPSSGYIKQLQISADHKLLIPSVSGGSTSTYIPDYISSATDSRIVYAGGDTSGGSRNGLFKIDANNDSTYTLSRIGARACISSANSNLIPIREQPVNIPIATRSTLGGVIIGNNLNIETDGLLSVPVDSTLSDSSSNPIENGTISRALATKVSAGSYLTNEDIDEILHL